MDLGRKYGSLEGFPSELKSEDELDDWLSRPSDVLIEFISTVKSPLVVLGAGGKMGPSLCVLARRAAERVGHNLDVVAVSRFTNPESRRVLERHGIHTQSCDLMEREALASLPDTQNVIYLVGLKFGTQQNPSLTWAANTLIPANVVERYAGARFVALSTGNVYPLSPVREGGSVEGDPLTPLGEYANACVARERIFQYASSRFRTPGVLIRLNYAVDLRYGVLVDLAQKIMATGKVDVTMGHLNCIWQRDANDMIIRALALAETPMRPLNLTGVETLQVRRLAEMLAGLLDLDVAIEGNEAPSALLNDAREAAGLLGAPAMPIDVVLQWTAEWVRSGRPLLGKPTHFEVRDGNY